MVLLTEAFNIFTWVIIANKTFDNLPRKLASHWFHFNFSYTESLITIGKSFRLYKLVNVYNVRSIWKQKNLRIRKKWFTYIQFMTAWQPYRSYFLILTSQINIGNTIKRELPCQLTVINSYFPIYEYQKKGVNSTRDQRWIKSPYLPFSGSALPLSFWTNFALLLRIDARNFDSEPLRFNFPG